MRPLFPLLAVLVAGGLLLPDLAPAQRKKKSKPDEEPVTQTLEIPPDPPSALTVETKRLGFLAAPLSANGLLSQQVRDGIRALWRLNRGAPIVKIRALVAGTGDLRRVSAIVSEMFTEKRLPLPVLSVVQVGALPLTGAQVQLEAVTQDPRRVPNPHGLAFISGQRVTGESAAAPAAPLVEKSIQRLQAALKEAAAEPLRVACFVHTLDDAAAQQAALARAFLQTPAFLAQTQRAPVEAVAECEAVARLQTPETEPARLLNPAGFEPSPAYSHIARIGAPRLVLAGTQIVFRYQESDVRLAFERLERTLAAHQSSLKRTVMLNYYPLSQPLTDLVRKVRFDFLDPRRPPASTLLLLEGLPGMDASIGLEAVALPQP